MTIERSGGLDLDGTPTKHDLYLQRLANTRRVMVSLDVPVMLVRDPFNVRYITDADIPMSRTRRVKLPIEDQLLITDTGVEIMNDYPFEERLLG